MANSVSIRLRIDAAGADEVFQRVGRSGETTVEKIRVAFGRLGADSASARVKIETIDPTLQRLSGSLNVLRSRWDENYRAEQQMARAQDTLNRSVAAGLIPLSESEKLLARVRQGYGAINDNLKQHTVSTNAAVASNGQMRASLVNLGQQAQDVVVSLQAGQPAMQVLLQQGSQIATVFAATPGGVTGVLSAAGTAIRGLVTPTTAAVAVLVGLGAAALVVLTRTASLTEQQRQLNLVLGVTGRISSQTTEQIAAENTALQKLGFTQEQIIQQRLRLARNPAVPEAARLPLQQVGAGVGAFLGVEPAEGVNQFVGALERGPAAFARWARDLNVLDAGQQQHISTLLAENKAIDAQRFALERLQPVMTRYAREAAGPLTEAVRELRGAWDGFLNRLAQSEAAIAAVERLTRLLRELGDVGESLRAIDRATQIPGLGPAVAPYVPVLPGARPLVQQEFRAPIPPGGSGYPFPIRGPTPGFPALPPAQGYQPTSGPGYPTTSTPYPQNIPPPRGGDPAWVTGLANPISLFPSAGQIAAGSRSTLAGLGNLNAAEVNQASEAVKRFTAETAQSVEISRKWGVQQEAAAAAAKYNEVMAQSDDATLAAAAATTAYDAVIAKHGIELDKQHRLTEAQIAADKRLATALQGGERQGVEVGAAEQARLEAMQKFGDAAQRQSYQELRAKQLIAAEDAKQGVALQRNVNDNDRQVELLTLQASLTGNTSEEINRQVALLSARQELQRRGVDLTSEEAANYLKSAQNLALANAQSQVLAREQQRIEEAVRSVASTIENGIGGALDDALSGRRLDDWGTRFKSIINSLLSDFVKFTLIRPALGQPCGFGEIGQFGEYAS